MLSPIQDCLLQNILVISKNLVILQTLRSGYLTELESVEKQETKNFRSGALLDLSRTILESMEPLMEYLVDIEEGKIMIYPEQRQIVNEMIIKLDEFYGWAAEQINIKNTRLELLKIEFMKEPAKE